MEKKIFCDIRKCVACKGCEIACAVEHSEKKNLISAFKQKPRPKKRVKTSSSGEGMISIHCQHCQDAPCIAACMSGAMTKDKQSGATIHNNQKCVGCWMCVMACPFGAIVRDIKEKRIVKCDLCPDREDYACVVACPTSALFVGTEQEFRKMIEDKKKKIKAGRP